MSPDRFLFANLLLLPLLALAQPDSGPFAGGGTATDRDPVPESRPREKINEAVEVLRDMESDSELRRVMEDSRGVFIVPEYASASLIIGTAGGEGVLLLRRAGRWRQPAFYRMGTLSAGIQVGITAGSVAMVLLSERAFEGFRQENNFSLSADAGFSVVEWSARARGELTSTSDLLLWTDTEGLSAELAVGVNNIIWDRQASQSFYGQPVDPEAVLGEQVTSPNAHLLREALEREQQ